MSSMFTRLRRCSVRGLGTRAEAPGCMIKGFGFKISEFRYGGYRAWSSLCTGLWILMFIESKTGER